MQAPRTVLVTGASSGVGNSLARYLADTYHVIVAARRIDRLRADFEGRDGFSVHQVDLGNADDTARFLTRVLEEHGYVPYVINNAGVVVRGRLEDLEPEELARSMEVNGYAPLRIMRGLLDPMKTNGFGRIINITSGAPLNCFPGAGAYSASKAFLNAVTVTFARELEDYDIKINLMSPGPVRSEIAPDAPMEPDACHPTVDHLLGLGADGPTGNFYWLGYQVPLFPDLEGVDWLGGIGNDRLTRVL